MAVAVIGDLCGHPSELVNALRLLGADRATLALPRDLTIIQTGGLLHEGPDPEGVLDLVELQLATGRWIQLVGHHEAHELGRQRYAAEGPPLREADRKRLRDWWDTGRLRTAAAVEIPDHGSLLVTHAGLTHGFWYELRSPATAEDAAAKLGDIAHADPDRYFRAGTLLGHPRSMAAGPVWADASTELYPSLALGVELGKPLPFGQVHGHTSPYFWSRGTWRASEHDRAGLRLVRDRRQVVGTVAGQPMAAVTPELGPAGGVRWEPLVLRDARVTTTA